MSESSSHGQGDNGQTRVVFIVSQPRAGSTLLQTMLGGHPQVTVPGEAWLMLPLVYAIQGSTRALSAPYDGYIADHAIALFARDYLPHGVRDIQRELGSAAARLYEMACDRAKTRVLIDKTPRYYWIIEDLLELLPECQVIILLRNPLAVLSSIVKTWLLKNLRNYRADLLEAPSRLANAAQLSNDRVLTVKYEHLVEDPERILVSIQSQIGIDPMEGLSQYGKAKPRTFGDPSGIYTATSANQSSLDKWIQDAARDASMWRLYDDYRRLLGGDLLYRLGYDPDAIERTLRAVKPLGTSIAPSLKSQLGPRPIEPIRSIRRFRGIVAQVASSTSRRAA